MNANTTEKPSIGLIVSGLLIVTLSSLWLIWTWRFVEASVSTYGEIVEIEWIGHYEGAYYPVFEYQTEGGSRFRDRGVGSSHPLYNVHKVYPVGARVPIIYDPNNPDHAQIDTFIQIWGGPIFVSLFSLFVGIKLVRADL